MDNDFFYALKDISLEAIIISVLVFALTMLIKWPIKKYTSKFEENKRKAINTIIVFIPLILSYLLSTLYFGIFRKVWYGFEIVGCTTTASVLSVTIYTIYSRVVNMIKAGRVNVSELGEETISYIKSNIKSISKTLKVDEKKLQTILSNIESLINLQNKVNTNSDKQDIVAAENFEKQLQSLKNEEESLQVSIEEEKKLLEAFKASLNLKGD